MAEPGYESSGCERSMGTKRLDTVQVPLNLLTQKCDFETKLTFQFSQDFCLLESRNLLHKGHASFMSESMETTFITLS